MYRTHREQPLPGLAAMTVPLLPVPAARSQTTVSGRIEQDTTWTQDSSPFVLIGQVVVVADVTLTIEPGCRSVGLWGRPSSSTAH